MRQFNQKINLISREDEAHIGEQHVRHVLMLTRHGFPDGAVVVDWGTGGGLPALPLAICCPAVHVHAVDAVGKKVQAVRAMARRLGLGNLRAWHGRAEQWEGRAHYSVSRATAPLEALWRWHVRVAAPASVSAAKGTWQPGLLCLKGGDLREEISALKAAYPALHVERHVLALLEPGSFADKYIIEVR